MSAYITESGFTRRDILAAAAAAAALATVGPQLEAAPPVPMARARMPVAYISHGSPMLAMDRRRGAEFTQWTRSMPTPVAVLMVSAHFERAPITIGATQPVPLIYDFGGFARALYEIKYNAPGAPKLARRITQVLRPLGAVQSDPKRGHDHGTWVPMKWMYPNADVPLLSLSLPTHNPRQLVQIGRALRPLRDEGVLIVGSGSLTHNLRDRAARSKQMSWATEFDAWAQQVLMRNDLDQLIDWQRKAPAAKRNHPTVEHFIPMLLTAGARHDNDAPTFPITGFDASFSRRCLSLVAPKPSTPGTPAAPRPG